MFVDSQLGIGFIGFIGTVVGFEHPEIGFICFIGTVVGFEHLGFDSSFCGFSAGDWF